MPKKRSGKTRDINRIATELLEEAVGEPAPITPAGKKNPAAADATRAVVRKKRAAAKAKGLPLKKRKT